jgi:hypothetical protein
MAFFKIKHKIVLFLWVFLFLGFGGKEAWALSGWLKTDVGEVFSNSGVHLVMPNLMSVVDYNIYQCAFTLPQKELVAVFKPDNEFSACRGNTFDFIRRPTNSTDLFSPQLGLLNIQEAVRQARDDGRLVDNCDQINNSPINLGNVVNYCEGDIYITDLLLGSHLVNYVAGKNGNGTLIIKGNLYIDGDITYKDGATTQDIDALPSFGAMVFSDPTSSGNTGNIYIKCGVQNLVGNFYAAGTINTCYNYIPLLNNNRKVLNISGSMTAKNFVLLRDNLNFASQPAERIFYDSRVLINTPPGMSDLVKGMPVWNIY